MAGAVQVRGSLPPTRQAWAELPEGVAKSSKVRDQLAQRLGASHTFLKEPVHHVTGHGPTAHPVVFHLPLYLLSIILSLPFCSPDFAPFYWNSFLVGSLEVIFHPLALSKSELELGAITQGRSGNPPHHLKMGSLSPEPLTLLSICL